MTRVDLILIQFPLTFESTFQLECQSLSILHLLVQKIDSKLSIPIEGNTEMQSYYLKGLNLVTLV